MKISVIFTGGTIGSALNDGYVGPTDSAKYVLLQHFDYYNDEVEFIPSSPYTALSENLSAHELNLLKSAISHELASDSDGIIVTHGTDTLQYSATAAELIFYGCAKPIVFVSANYPLGDSRSNGFANFVAAVEFLKTKPQGVFVSYKNDNENTTSIHIASHTLCHRECDANVYSIVGFPYAEYDGKSITFSEKNKAHDSNASCDFAFSDASGILAIESYPGDSYSYSLDGVKSVLLRPYHSATLCTASENLKEFCKRASGKGIPVFVVNVKGGTAYESTKEFSRLGITPLPYSTFISAYMKLWIAHSAGIDAKEFAKKRIANEIDFE